MQTLRTTTLKTAQSRVVLFKSATSGFRMTLERRYAKAAEAAFGKWYTEISRLLVASGTLEALAPQARLVQNSSLGREGKIRAANTFILAATLRLSDFVPQMQGRRDLEKIMQFRNMQAYNLGAVTALESMGFRARSSFLDRTESKALEEEELIVFGLTDEEIIDQLMNRPVLVGASTSKVAIENTRRMIRDELFTARASIAEAVERIAASEGIKEWQALRITRTETQVAINSAANAMYGRSGVKKKSWLTVGDHRVRAAHVTNEADGPIPFNKPFSSGQMHPGDGAQSVNCRCSLEADLSDPSILLEPWDGSGGFHMRTGVGGTAGGL